MRRRAACVVLLATLIGGIRPCAGGGEVLARVGDVQITAADLEAARQRLEGPLRRQGDRWLLETLVKRQLLVQEARRLGLGDGAGVRSRLAVAVRDRLRDMLFERRVVQATTVDERDVQEALATAAIVLPAEVRVSQIVAATAAVAESLAAELAAGADFGELARRHSVERHTGARGGDVGYWREGEVTGPLAEAVFALRPGEISPPLTGPDGRFYLFTVRERRPLGVAAQDSLVRERVHNVKIRAARAAFADSLWSAYGGQVDSAAVDLLVQRGKRAWGRVPPLEPADSARVLVRTATGEVSVGQYVQWLRGEESAARLPAPWHREQVERYVRGRTITALLYPAEARRLGLDREAAFASWQTQKYEDLLIEALRAERVEARVMDPAAWAAGYEAVRDSLAHPERLLVEAAVLPDAQAAEQVYAAASAGEDLERCVRRYPPPDSTDHYWVFSFSHHGGRGFAEPPALVAAARRATAWPAPPPVRIERGDGLAVYAVFRLLDRMPAGPPAPDEPRVRQAIRARLEQERAAALAQAFTALVEQLRADHAGELVYTEAGSALR